LVIPRGDDDRIEAFGLYHTTRDDADGFFSNSFFL